MTPDYARLQMILGEIRRRTGKRISLVDPNFPLQAQILGDDSLYQAWQCTRRGAKTTTFVKKSIGALDDHPGSVGIYAALTLNSAKAIAWEIYIGELNKKAIKYTPYEREGIIKFSNGSTLYMFGVNSNYKEMAKVLGRKIRIFGLDESGSMTIDMIELVYKAVHPATIDVGGSIVLLGTSENIPNTFFEKVMKGAEKTLRWKRYIWTTEQNPYTAKQFIAQRDQMIADNPSVVKASWFRTHWLNEWCADDDLLIYKIVTQNFTDIYPLRPIYCLGVDLGFNDACAFVMYGWAQNDPNLYMLETFKKAGMDITDTANKIHEYLCRYPNAMIAIDGANKQAVEEMRKRHKLPMLQAADKTDKASYLRLFSDDIKQLRVLIHEPKCQDFTTEAASLMWEKDTNKEDERCENHVSDAALYAWRLAKNYTFTPEVKEWKPKNQRMRDYFEKEIEQMQSQEDPNKFLF